MFDKEYYDKKEQDLKDKLAKEKDRALGSILTTVNELIERQREIQSEYQELLKIKDSSKKKKKT